MRGRQRIVPPLRATAAGTSTPRDGEAPLGRGTRTGPLIPSEGGRAQVDPVPLRDDTLKGSGIRDLPPPARPSTIPPCREAERKEPQQG